ncbi:translation initiation factor IF-2 [Candidatus Bipolaricaulota bacterium]
MPKKRIYEIARELGVTSKDLVARLEEMGMPGLKAANSVDEEEHALIVNLYQEEGKPPAKAQPEVKQEKESSMDVAESEEKPTAAAKIRIKATGDPRPPIVSVLGHIDHGKTTLLDAIRDSHLASKEAGGITQGIAAYQAELSGKRITFIDTPGHKAFTGMRARGAQVTDIAVLVVAADDGVMAQTVEAIDHIKAAGVPMIVAVNKIDKANADASKVMNDLAQRGLMPEAWGGDTITVELSALEGKNIDELLEMILLVSEMEDLRGDPKADLEAVIIESHLSSGRGPVATAVVRNGMLQIKDWVVAGNTYGRVKALQDETGARVEHALPGQAVQVIGLCDVPTVGTLIEVATNQAKAKKLAEQRANDEKLAKQADRRPVTIDDLFRQEEEEIVRLRLVLKASSTGALEAARREVEGLAIEGAELEILSTGVGAISESDVLLASTISEESLAVGFGVTAEGKAMKAAERAGVMVLSYDIIYDLVRDIEQAMKRRLAPEFREVQIGKAEVRDLFKVPTGVVAGCYVADGRVSRRARIRVMREGSEMFTGDIASLRRFEDDVREVASGRECGIRIGGFDDVQIGDQLVIFELEEVER